MQLFFSDFLDRFDEHLSLHDTLSQQIYGLVVFYGFLLFFWIKDLRKGQGISAPFLVKRVLQSLVAEKNNDRSG
ncbi:MAG: hypothetical protein AAF376_08230 [Pseudomonadota bacterium]